MPTYKMLSDGFIQRFRSFMAAENNPAGAFDQALPKTSQRKESTMPKFRYTPVAGTAGALYTRERMALDAAGEDPNEIVSQILQFLGGKISDDDLAQVKELLKIEAGEDPDSMKEAKQMASAARSRGAMDARRVAPSSPRDFESRFPGSKHIGRDDKIGVR